MAEVKENGKHVAQAGGGQEAKADRESLKKRIQKHYDMSAEQFLKVWGEHIHHGYFKTPSDSNDQAQLNQVILMADSAGLSAGSRVLDVGCGIGGSARYLARERDCKVTAISNSRRQVEMARELTAAEAAGKTSPSSSPPSAKDNIDFVQLSSSASSADTGTGAVRVLNLDADKMREHLAGTLGETFDCIWMSEVIFHLHTRQLCFESAFGLLDSGGCFVIADIFRTAEDPASSSKRVKKELASIRRNHLCPELGTVSEYTEMARKVGFRLRQEPLDITKNVARTWDVPLPIGSVLYLITQGRDAIGYMRGMRSMKNAYAHGTASYVVLCFEKP
ncbi:gamma-tocopherol methyltransferas-like protein [Bimuria novae-zelandiae CBS 107.79]|uniref:Gamma-tocopherol methyltransferas-like protein n=1 Tax=Bimuria novae-zelandiae CBS 107.79 TaxID=1447943 RepID=A0A6A5VD83_9PLEO|nr:gamma-tocopherol methyltransferas-like protein [Bimuria novae-zelandiae CBS 107.79]